MMKLVIDTNRIMAGLLKQSTSREIIIDDHFFLYAPDYIETELFRHREYLMKKANLREPDFDTLLHILLGQITLVPFEDFKGDYSQAIRTMESVDENDAPFLAVGLALRLDGIWTEDRHFLRQDLLKVYHTGDLIQIR
jgi:predicted nucleic acid-binding protein